MSRADRIEQERLADLYQITRRSKPIDVGAPRRSRTETAKMIAEGIGIGWFLRRVVNIFTH